jgi:hypothetical protein
MRARLKGLWGNRILCCIRRSSGNQSGRYRLCPGPALSNPRGIRDVEEWYVSLLTRQDFIREVFSRITDIGLQNLKLFHQAVGERIQVIVFQELILVPKMVLLFLKKYIEKYLNLSIRKLTTGFIKTLPGKPLFIPVAQFMTFYRI